MKPVPVAVVMVSIHATTPLSHQGRHPAMPQVESSPQTPTKATSNTNRPPVRVQPSSILSPLPLHLVSLPPHPPSVLGLDLHRLWGSPLSLYLNHPRCQTMSAKADHAAGNSPRSMPAYSLLISLESPFPEKTATYNLCSSLRIVKEKQHLTTGWFDSSLGFFSEHAVRSVSCAGSKAMVPNSSQ